MIRLRKILSANTYKRRCRSSLCAFMRIVNILVMHGIRTYGRVHVQMNVYRQQRTGYLHSYGNGQNISMGKGRRGSEAIKFFRSGEENEGLSKALCSFHRAPFSFRKFDDEHAVPQLPATIPEDSGEGEREDS